MAYDKTSFHTAAKRIRYLGSAKTGTRQAWHMRLTSLALLPLSIAFVWLVLSLVGRDYNQVRLVLARPFPAILLLLFILAGVYHMQLGMQTIIEDYVHVERNKSWSLVANTFFCFVLALACVYAVLRLSFT